MTNTQSPVSKLLESSAQKAAPLDYTLLRVTLTVAVESFVCDEHEHQATDSAIETVLSALHALDTETPAIVVLGSEFDRLRVVQTW